MTVQRNSGSQKTMKLCLHCLKDNFCQELYTQPNYQFRVKTEETFSDMQDLKNDLFPMHLFAGEEGVRQEREESLGKGDGDMQ